MLCQVFHCLGHHRASVARQSLVAFRQVSLVVGAGCKVGAVPATNWAQPVAFVVVDCQVKPVRNRRNYTPSSTTIMREQYQPVHLPDSEGGSHCQTLSAVVVPVFRNQMSIVFGSNVEIFFGLAVRAPKLSVCSFGGCRTSTYTTTLSQK